jgi:hypothetical protein
LIISRISSTIWSCSSSSNRRSKPYLQCQSRSV